MSKAESPASTRPARNARISCSDETPAREQQIKRTREAIKARGGKWLGAYVKIHNPGSKLLADHTDAELAALYAAATHEHDTIVTGADGTVLATARVIPGALVA